MLVKCYDNKMVKLPYNFIILPFIKPEVANQQQKKIPGHKQKQCLHFYAEQLQK